MSIMDDVAALRALAADIPTAAVQQAQQTLLEMNAKLVGILGPDFGAHKELRQRASTADIRVNSAIVACQVLEDAINDAADALQQAGS